MGITCISCFKNNKYRRAVVRVNEFLYRRHLEKVGAPPFYHVQVGTLKSSRGGVLNNLCFRFPQALGEGVGVAFVPRWLCALPSLRAQRVV